MSEPKLGRLSANEVSNPIVLDQPSKHSLAVLTKLDEVLVKLNLIADAIETATDGPSLFTALDTAEIKAAISELKFHL